MSDDLLAIYLTDHLAGATGGSNRMRSLADHERSVSASIVGQRSANQPGMAANVQTSRESGPNIG